MTIRIIVFVLLAPSLLCGQQFFEARLSHILWSQDYPGCINVEYGNHWWGVEAEVGYLFGDRLYLTPLINGATRSTNYFYKVENFQWRLLGNFYPFTKSGAGQGLKLGLGFFDYVETWRDPNYYTLVQTYSSLPIVKREDRPFRDMEFGFQMGYKHLFWDHLVVEISLMITYSIDTYGSRYVPSTNGFFNLIVGYRF